MHFNLQVDQENGMNLHEVLSISTYAKYNLLNVLVDQVDRPE